MKSFIKIVSLAVLIVCGLPKESVALPETKPFTPSIIQIVVKQAQIYATPVAPILATMRCESGLDPQATNHTSREFSVGIAQINLKAHPDITETQARDPEFAAAFIAEQFSTGHASQWTCAHMLKIVK